MIAALRSMNTMCQLLEPAAVRSHLCNLHRMRVGRPVRGWLVALQRANAALVAQRLHGLLGDPALIGYAREGLHLARTFSELMEWQLHSILHATAPLALLQAVPSRFAAAAIEHHTAALHRCCGDLAGSLEHHLRERLT